MVLRDDAAAVARYITPTGESPVPVTAAAPGSRSQGIGGAPCARAGCQSIARWRAAKQGARTRAPARSEACSRWCAIPSVCLGCSVMLRLESPTVRRVRDFRIHGWNRCFDFPGSTDERRTRNLPMRPTFPTPVAVDATLTARCRRVRAGIPYKFRRYKCTRPALQWQYGADVGSTSPAYIDAASILRSDSFTPRSVRSRLPLTPKEPRTLR